MLRQILSRLLYTLPVIWLVVSTVFLLIHFVPGDPIQQMLGEGAASADIQAARHAYGLDVPLGQQYLNYWKGVLHGDLGKSLRFNQGVTSLIANRYPNTLELTLASLFVAIILAIPAGVRSARRRNRWDDRVLSVVSLFGLSFPNFALGPVLILFFAIEFSYRPSPITRGRARAENHSPEIISLPDSTQNSREAAKTAFMHLPLSFEAAEASNQFLVRGSGYRLLLTPTQATIAINDRFHSCRRTRSIRRRTDWPGRTIRNRRSRRCFNGRDCESRAACRREGRFNKSAANCRRAQCRGAPCPR